MNKKSPMPDLTNFIQDARILDYSDSETAKFIGASGFKVPPELLGLPKNTPRFMENKVFKALETTGGSLGEAGKVFASPITRTLATGGAAIRGAYNLATNQIDKEAAAQKAEELRPLEHRPVRT